MLVDEPSVVPLYLGLLPTPPKKKSISKSDSIHQPKVSAKFLYYALSISLSLSSCGKLSANSIDYLFLSLYIYLCLTLSSQKTTTVSKNSPLSLTNCLCLTHKPSIYLNSQIECKLLSHHNNACHKLYKRRCLEIQLPHNTGSQARLARVAVSRYSI